MLLVAVNKIVASLLSVCCWIQRDACCRDTGNMQHVAAQYVACCQATCCPGVNAALFSQIARQRRKIAATAVYPPAWISSPVILSATGDLYSFYLPISAAASVSAVVTSHFESLLQSSLHVGYMQQEAVQTQIVGLAYGIRDFLRLGWNADDTTDNTF